ncbi:matrixin family metalloprotease [Aeromicrobium marinum]|nr:matrixin family metalloprotease [Aeromicrobium marinum]
MNPTPVVDRRARRRAVVAMGGFLLVLGAVLGKIVLDPEGTGVIVTWDPSSVADPSDVRTTADGGQYAFLTTQADSDEPVAYDPCRPVRVVVNTLTGPPGALELVDDALEEMSSLTGLRFDLEGETTEAPSNDWQPERSGDDWQPVLIAWTDDDEVPDLAGNVLGLGGSAWTDEGGARRYVTGQVLLDGPQLATLGEDQTRATLLHELGHLVGLDHVEDEGALMQPLVGPLEWGSGDLAGLEQLGQGSCA